MPENVVCTVCEAYGPARKQTKGSFLIELFLWLMLIVPGVLYSLWRLTSRARVCASCGSAAIVPASSPAGRRILDAQREQRRAYTRAMLEE